MFETPKSYFPPSTVQAIQIADDLGKRLEKNVHMDMCEALCYVRGEVLCLPDRPDRPVMPDKLDSLHAEWSECDDWKNRK